MKMMNCGFLVVLLCVVCGQAAQFLDKPAPEAKAKAKAKAKGGEKAAPEEAAKKVPEDGGKKAPEEGAPKAPEEGGKPEGAPWQPPPQKDNFQEEVLDQADNEFALASGGDDCLTWKEMRSDLRKQFAMGAPDKGTMTMEEKQFEEEIMAEMTADAQVMYNHADANADGCIDKAEYKAAGEMEGPPPGFQKEKMGGMGPFAEMGGPMNKDDYMKQMAEEEKFEFESMDRSGDGKISKSESYHYASENMPTAEVDKAMMDQMFDDTDTNKDGFLTFDEFSTAGEAIEGDGKEMEKAVPMMFMKIRKGRKALRISAVRKQMLAQKPPRKIMAHFLTREEPTATEEDAEPAEEAAPVVETAKGNETEGNDTALSGPAHRDNFQDELVDQADNEFEMMSGGDNCMTWDEFKAILDQQFQPRAPDIASMTEETKKEIKAIQKAMTANFKMMYEHVDQNKDGCVDKKEFKKAEEMEGPPPGFQETKEDEMGEEDFEKEMEEEDKYEFDAMDRSGDQMVSKAEAYHYANENMPNADIDQETMDNMFDEADENNDGLLSYEEFIQAGENYDGDGNEMEKAEPMSFKINMAKRKSSLRDLEKRCLAHKPPLKMLGRAVSRFMKSRK